MKRQLTLLAFVLILAGCDTAKREQELQQQKLLLELTKTNNERLAELTKKEQELKSLEKSNQNLLQQVQQQQELLQRKGNEIARAEKELAEKVAQAEKELTEKVAEAEAKIRDERKSMESDRERLRAAELQTQQAQQAVEAKEADLTRSLAAISEGQEAERKAREVELRKHEERQRPEIVGRLNRRQPYLKYLIDSATDVAMKRNQNLVQSTIHKGLSDTIARVEWGKIVEEDEFAQKASSMACAYITKEWIPSVYGMDVIEVVNKWRDDYLAKCQKQAAVEATGSHTLTPFTKRP